MTASWIHPKPDANVSSVGPRVSMSRSMLSSQAMVKINVLYFAHVKALIGSPREQFVFDRPLTTSALLAHVASAYPEVEPLGPHLRVAVNGGYAEPDVLIPDGAEVALIPPVAGGMA